MTANEDAVIAAEKLAIHEKLVNRIVARAVADGKPLTSIQIRQFESDSIPKEEYWKFDKEFKRENEWQDFMDRISGLLRSAIAEDAANDPDAPVRYNKMVQQLEDRPESFTLWACCVPAIPGYKSIQKPGFISVLTLLGVVAVIVLVILHLLKRP